MNQDGASLEVAGVELDPSGAFLIPDEKELDKQAEVFRKDLKNEMDQAGTFTSVDKFYLNRIVDVYRVYIGISEKIKNKYTEIGRFGEDKPHHLLSELRAHGKMLDDLLKEGGLTPRSRRIAGMNSSTDAPHGNSKESKFFDMMGDE